MNDFLPGGAGLTVKGGRTTVDGRFETGKGGACGGRVTVTTRDLVLDAGGVENAGNVEATIEVPQGNLRDLLFSLDRTRVRLEDFAFTSRAAAQSAPDWRGRVAVTEGTLDLRATPDVDVRLDVTLSDPRPLVAFLSREKPLGDWKERMLTVEEIQGEGVARFMRGATTVHHFGLRSEKIDVRFRALVDSRGAFGKARARYGILKVGIGLRGRDRDLKVTRVGTWHQRDDIPGMPPLLPEFEEIGAP